MQLKWLQNCLLPKWEGGGVLKFQQLGEGCFTKCQITKVETAWQEKTSGIEGTSVNSIGTDTTPPSTHRYAGRETELGRADHLERLTLPSRDTASWADLPGRETGNEIP